MALLVVAALSVNKKNGKVQDVKVCDQHAPSLGLTLDNLTTVAHHVRALNVSSGAQDLVTRKTGGKAVRPRLDPIAEVVDVSGHTPPASSKQLAALLGLDVLEVRDSGVVGVSAEAVLLVVGRAEDVKAKTNKAEHCSETQRAEGHGMDGEVSGLKGVDIRHPDDIAKGKHHTEAIGGDVHRRQNCGLVPPRVKDIQSLDSGDQDGAISHVTVVAVLLSAPRTVHDDPTHHTGTKLEELLQVNLADKRDDNTRVEFATNEPIVQHVS